MLLIKNYVGTNWGLINIDQVRDCPRLKPEASPHVATSHG